MGAQQHTPVFLLVGEYAAAAMAVALDVPPDPRLPSESRSQPVSSPLPAPLPVPRPLPSPAKAGIHQEKCCLSHACKFWKCVKTGGRSLSPWRTWPLRHAAKILNPGPWVPYACHKSCHSVQRGLWLQENKDSLARVLVRVDPSVTQLKPMHSRNVTWEPFPSAAT